MKKRTLVSQIAYLGWLLADWIGSNIIDVIKWLFLDDDKFKGPKFHTAQWRPDVDLKNKKVAVIGTGASAVQTVPNIVKDVKELHVFQRTPAWVPPRGDFEYSLWIKVLTSLFCFVVLFVSRPSHRSWDQGWLMSVHLVRCPREFSINSSPCDTTTVANSCNQHFSLEGDITLGGHPSKYWLSRCCLTSVLK
jgi:hypothetical protein